MKVATLIARILLGLLFTVLGAFGFIIVSGAVAPPPPPPGLATNFMEVFFASRWVLFVDGIQVISGLLLLTNRFVPLAIVMLGAVLFNVFVFHITMQPSGLPLPIVALVLWIVVARAYRSYLRPLFTANAVPE